ncbi:MAG: hypothetical protein WDZ85_03905 [Candidatus Paceibacterota bacterium]
MIITESEEFCRDFKKLLKKYRTLKGDFEVAKKAISAEPTGDGSKHWHIIKQKDEAYILKIRMMCRAVKGASFRLVYFYDGKTVEVIFIEIFFKGRKSLPNQKRIKRMVKKLMG